MAPIYYQCSCGAIRQFKPEYAGKRTKCKDCGAEITVPSVSRTVETQPIIVIGQNKSVVAALSYFLNLARLAVPQSNQLFTTTSHLTVTIDSETQGDAFTRYTLFSMLGRPRITVSFTYDNESRRISQGTYSQSAFFQDPRDVGFRGGAFGGSESSFLRTNCRNIAKKVIENIANAMGISVDDRHALVQAVEGEPASYTRYYVFCSLIMPVVPIIPFILVPAAWRVRSRAQSQCRPTRWYTALLIWSTVWLLVHVSIFTLILLSGPDKRL